MTGNNDNNTQRRYLKAICENPEVLERKRFSVTPYTGTVWLLRAAIITNNHSVVENVLSNPKTPSTILDNGVQIDMFQPTMYLAGKGGSFRILETLLSASRFCAEDFLREHALAGAIAAGNLPTIKFILSLILGPTNFISSNLCIEEDLCFGMLNSADVEFCAKLYDLLASYSTATHPIEIGIPPDANHQLHDICGSKIQREDIAAHLIASGALVQAKTEHVKNRVGAYQKPDQGPHRPWNPLRVAVCAGNEKIVKLLLEHGAHPSELDDDVLWFAARQGRLDIVKMLVAYGADVNIAPKLSLVEKRYLYEAPIVMAVLAENVELCDFLVDEAGAYLEGELRGVEALHRAADEGLESMVRWLGNRSIDTSKASVRSAAIDSKILRCRPANQVLGFSRLGEGTTLPDFDFDLDFDTFLDAS